MRASPRPQQSAIEVAGQIAASAVVFIVIWSVMARFQDDHLSLGWAISTGILVGAINIAREYRRRTPSERLAPVPTMLLAAVQFAVLAWVVWYRNSPADRSWIVWVLVVLLAVVPSYLLWAGVRQYLTERRLQLR